MDFLYRTATLIYNTPLLKIKTICHAWDLRKLARSCKQLYLLCLPHPWNLPCIVLLSGFQSSHGSFEIHWVRQYLLLSKCNFYWKKIPVNIWKLDLNDCKTQKQLVHIFLKFWYWYPQGMMIKLILTQKEDALTFDMPQRLWRLREANALHIRKYPLHTGKEDLYRRPEVVV